MGDDHHPFGGPWTEIKLAAIDAYAHFYTTALQHKNFALWYIDAFAGTGSRHEKQTVGGLFDGAPIDIEEVALAGSARRALDVRPPFRHFVLIDQKEKHYRALCTLRDAHPDREVRVLQGNAHDRLAELFAEPPWIEGAHGWRSQRALVFLDPYAMSVHWPTLELLAATERADVWYLANLKAAVQQLALAHAKLDEGKRRALSDFFGTPDWEPRFYRFLGETADLFTGAIDPGGQRIASREEIAAFYREQLGTLFRYVSTPLGLAVGSHQDYFQLYCLSNNPSPNALALIKRGAEGVINKHAQASRRKSGP